MVSSPPGGRALLVAVVPAAFLAYALLAVVIEARWGSALAAALVAWLLWRRHTRSRFAAYVFASVVGVRAVASARWTTVLFAVAMLALLQTPAARRAWPRLTWRGGRRQSGDDDGSARMTPP